MTARWIAIAASFVAPLVAGEGTPPPVIRSAALDAVRPYFIPTHPRVTTTVRFPKEIGAPDGSVAVFAEDAAKAGRAEYLVTWQPGESYFTVTPLRRAGMANLNVPYRGSTYVLYFYPVDDPLDAAAAVTLEESVGTARSGTGAGLPVPAEMPPKATLATEVRRELGPPETTAVDATPARLLGFLDRLKLIHATAPGPPLDALAAVMNVQIALSREEAGAGYAADTAAASELIRGVNDYGWYQLILLRAVRDRRLNCIGFICLVRNTSDRVLAFDVNSFGARAGAEYFVQRVSDAAAIVQPHDQVPAYFVVQPGRNSPLLASNAWRISIDLLSPRLNPGAAIARTFANSP
jgi:hypothetical protein